MLWGLQQPVLRIWQTAYLLAAKQRAQPAALPICKAESVTLSGQGAQLAVLPDLGDQLSVECVLWACKGREANPQPRPTTKHRLSPTQSGSLAKDLGVSYSPMQAGNQVHSSAQLWSTASGPT